MIHSVFKTAANIAFPTGFMLSLNAAGTCRMANGIEITPGLSDYPLSSLRAQLPVLFGAQRLIIDAVECALDLSCCPQWDAQIERPTSLHIDTIRHRSTQLRRYASTASLPRFTSVLMMANSLCGRGPGLTPSGDDILAGWMAMRWLLEGPSANLLAACQQIVDVASLQTHLLSQCWLGYAAKGQVAQPIAALLTSLSTANDTELASAIQTVLSMGATSGHDLLTGMLLALNITMDA